MKEIYHTEEKHTRPNNLVADKVAAIVQHYNPMDGWKVGEIGYDIHEQETTLTIPLSQYDERIPETQTTYTVENERVEEKLRELELAGYEDFQVIPSGKNSIIVAVRPYAKDLGTR